MKKHPLTLSTDKTVLLIIDIQEKILNVMHSPENVISNTTRLIQGFKVLNLPIFYTEQYPKGLGKTAPEILLELSHPAIQKMSFSCCNEGNLLDDLNGIKCSQIVVCGIEGHICVQQTVLDLLANGFQVNVAADAVSSRKEFDYHLALQRMAKHGAEITTCESILFELLQVSGTEQFRQISKIVK